MGNASAANQFRHKPQFLMKRNTCANIHLAIETLFIRKRFRCYQMVERTYGFPFKRSRRGTTFVANRAARARITPTKVDVSYEIYK